MNNLGLDIFLQPKNSPIVNNQKVVSSYDFDGQYERNSVGNNKIAYMSADKIASGTVIVGLNLGSSTSGYVLLDGANNRILVHDGTTNRIVIGSV